ncbi:hypothetical protein B1748_07890 [Paenibacillus sp. MY03]|uniref:response regulator transcription factor n=1 Tax=Paenibacillus sp. MY03 TaxID=302980 RepID=UPI000B3BE468|nr:response regulator [Paenibacillus sp. MY03]OUS77069.1 hypothetical protein B1748_07890 [Paenibacillus sp. MY03]
MNVLIVDDEFAIREGLRDMLKQLANSGIPIHQVETSIDGNHAMDILHYYHFDLLITDVRMPGMDGLTLLEHVQSRFPKMKTIILSGFDEFAYVQQALRLGAIDYLLKPVNVPDLTKTIERISSGLNDTYNIHRSWKRFNELDAFKLLAVVDIDNPQETRALEFGDWQTLSWMLRKSSFEILQDMTGVYLIEEMESRMDSCNMICGFTGESPERAMEQFERFASALFEFWEDRVRLSISIGVSRPYRHDHSEEAPYSEALTALLTRLYRGSCIQKYPEDEQAEIGSASFARLWQQLEVSLDVGDIDRVIERLHEFVRESVKQGTPRQLMWSLERLMLDLNGRINQNALIPFSIEARHITQKVNQMQWSRSEEALQQQIGKWINDLLLSSDPEEQEGQIMLKAKKYIREHLGEMISLEEVSQHTYISRSHLSRLFRIRTGQTFLEYLTDLKIEESKKMLTEPGIKIYEVAEKLGYRDWKHFSRTFKNKTGYGPAEYRANLNISPLE